MKAKVQLMAFGCIILRVFKNNLWIAIARHAWKIKEKRIRMISFKHLFEKGILM